MKTRIRGIARRIGLAALPAVIAVLLVAPGSLYAAPATSLSGEVTGIELCPLVWCGSAIFVGRFDGSLDGDAHEGHWWVLVNHDDLPLRGETSPITGGMWGMVVGERPLRGAVSGGTILNNGDDTFTVMPTLDVRVGGEGTLALTIRLDHGTFPPTVGGSVAVAPVAALTRLR